jgi:hypothetical protein
VLFYILHRVWADGEDKRGADGLQSLNLVSGHHRHFKGEYRFSLYLQTSNMDVSTSIYFMKKTNLHDVEKPYAFRYAVEGIKQTNMEMEKVADIAIVDIRGKEEMYSLEEHGFEILKLSQEPGYDSLFNEAGLSRYFEILEDLLKKRLGASEVRVFRHGLRKRHPEFPVSTGESYEYDQPTSVAHIG